MLHLHPYVQAKSFARNHGQMDENDKGYVSIMYNTKVTRSFKTSRHYAQFYHLSLLCAFVFLNILTPIVLAKLVSLHYPKMKTKALTGDFMRYLYWAGSFMAFLINVGYTVVSLSNHVIRNRPTITSCIIHLSKIPCTIPSDTSVYQVEVLTLVAKFTVIPVAVIMELLTSVYIMKNNYNIRLRFVGFRCSSLKHFLLLTIRMLALWNILISLQLFSMLAIPLCVLLLIRPQITFVSTVSLLMVPVGFTLVAACFPYQCRKRLRRRNFQSNARCCGSICLYFVVITATVGLILTLLVLYELMLLVQVQIETGVKGIVLSLLPSFPLSALGWYLKRRSQKRSNTDLDEKMLQLLPKEGSPCMTPNSNGSDSGDALPLPL